MSGSVTSGGHPQWKSINKCWSITRHVVVWILLSHFSIIRITSFGDRIQFRFIRVVSYIFLVQGDASGIKGNFPSFLFSLFSFLLLSIFFVCVTRHTFKYFRQYFSLTLHPCGL